MHGSGSWSVAVGVLALVSAMAPRCLGRDDPPPAPREARKAEESADRKFDRLSAEALKAPGKADWRALRRAFAETSYYHPYNIDVDRKLREVDEAIGKGEFVESEAALLKLVEDERHMRFESVGMLAMLYEKSGRPEKAERLGKILDAIVGVLNYPDDGTSFDDPIEVLFIGEEYFATRGMPKAGRKLVEHDGHWFDVFDIKADGDEPAKSVYFNVDLPRKAMTRELEGTKPAVKDEPK